jgi:hypothetical protein
MSPMTGIMFLMVGVVGILYVLRRRSRLGRGNNHQG